MDAGVVFVILITVFAFAAIGYLAWKSRQSGSESSSRAAAEQERNGRKQDS
jgi:hypothetical protein